MLGDLRAAVATAGAAFGAEAVSDADPAESTFVPHNFLQQQSFVSTTQWVE